MNLEDQVCSLELAKRLKELGAVQESCFYWVRPPGSTHWSCWFFEKLSTSTGETANWDQISAFTVAELGERLPVGFYSGRSGVGSPWICKARRKSLFEVDDFEADARAKMVIWLLEKGLVKP